MIGSKYLHSDLNGCFTKIKDIIATGHRVLFSGTGCQRKALDRYLREKSCRDKAIIIAVICHGVPIQLAWEKYREKLEKELQTMRESEMWQAGAVVRKLRPENN